MLLHWVQGACKGQGGEGSRRSKGQRSPLILCLSPLNPAFPSIQLKAQAYILVYQKAVIVVAGAMALGAIMAFIGLLGPGCQRHPCSTHFFSVAKESVSGLLGCIIPGTLTGNQRLPQVL